MFPNSSTGRMQGVLSKRKVVPFGSRAAANQNMMPMIAIGLLFLRMLCDFTKPQQRLGAEILVLRHQLNVLLQRTPRRRLRLRWANRLCSYGSADAARASLMP
jgi:hypothetical protein